MGGHWHCFSVRFGRVPRGRIGRGLIWTAGFVPAARPSIPLLEFEGLSNFPKYIRACSGCIVDRASTNCKRFHFSPRRDFFLPSQRGSAFAHSELSPPSDATHRVSSCTPSLLSSTLRHMQHLRRILAELHCIRDRNWSFLICRRQRRRSLSLPRS